MSPEKYPDAPPPLKLLRYITKEDIDRANVEVIPAGTDTIVLLPAQDTNEAEATFLNKI